MTSFRKHDVYMCKDFIMGSCEFLQISGQIVKRIREVQFKLRYKLDADACFFGLALKHMTSLSSVGSQKM